MTIRALTSAGRLFKGVTSKTDLINVRLASKSLSRPATRRLFSKEHIVLPALADDPKILENIQNIIASPALVKEVRHLKYTTSLEPNKTLDDYNYDEAETELSTDMKSAIRLLNQFPNLTHLEIEFSCVCANPEPDNFWSTSPEESLEFRTQVLTSFFIALNDVEYPTPNLRCLTIKNLQNVNDKALVRSENFINVLKRISELRLKIVTEHDEAAPETAWDRPEMHDFMAELPKVWLEPARKNLAALTIHMDDFWGYFPKCDFRSLRFTNLKRLELGNWTITHDWQIDWILSHKDTLEELVLDDCPIVRYIANYGQLNEEKYPVMPASLMGDISMWHYRRKWSDIFGKLQEELSKLRRLRFGVGQWRDGENFDGEEWVSTGMHGNIYMFFNRGTGPSPWVSKDDGYEGGESDMGDENEEGLNITQTPPATVDEEEDENGEGINIPQTPPAAVDEEEETAPYLSLMAVLARR